MRDVDELAAIGLPSVAAVVLDFVSDAPSGEANPFDVAIDPANHRDWNRRHRGIWQGYLKTDDSEGLNG